METVVESCEETGKGAGAKREAHLYRKAEREGGTGSQRKTPRKKASLGIPSLTVSPLSAKT